MRDFLNLAQALADAHRVRMLLALRPVLPQPDGTVMTTPTDSELVLLSNRSPFPRSPTMNKQRVLFVCIHNSARSQMAEAWLNHLGGGAFEAESAGLEPGTLNPLVVEVMREAGIDVAHKQTKSVFDDFKSGRLFAYVITVCDEASAERCPIFPGVAKRLHWSFPDPSRVTGSPDEKRAQVRVIRDQIRDRVKSWLAERR